MPRILSRFVLFCVMSCALMGSGKNAAATQLLATNFYNSSVDLYELSENSVTLVQSGFIASGSAGMSFPTKVIVEGDRIYVANRGTGKVNVYDLNGQPAAGPGGLGIYADVGSGSSPFGMAFKGGLLYVADQGGSAVHIFDGSSVTATGTIPGDPNTSPMLNPSGLDFDTEGNLWISTFRGGFLPSEVYRWDGTNLDLIVDQATAFLTGLFGAAGIETSGSFATNQGVIHVAALAANGVGFYSETGLPTSPFNVQIPFPVPPNASFAPSNAPSDLIFDGDDLLIAVMGPTAPGEQDPQGNSSFPLGGILRVKPDGSLITLAYPMMPASSIALLEVEEVPEPATLGLGMAGLMVLGCWCWKRRRLAG